MLCLDTLCSDLVLGYHDHLKLMVVVTRLDTQRCLTLVYLTSVVVVTSRMYIYIYIMAVLTQHRLLYDRRSAASAAMALFQMLFITRSFKLFLVI